MSPVVVNILDLIDLGGSSVIEHKLATFSSPNNPEIEEFIRNKAIGFANGKLSITYLVNDEDTGNVLGFFTLTHKSIIVNGENLSTTSKKKLARYSRLDPCTGNYMASSFLIAQFGKNYALDEIDRINGADLMKIATDVLVSIQRQIGGGIVYLDCEDKPELVSFYTGQNFKKFDDRFSAEDNQKYIQFMRFF
ncbi:MAG: GNAT family acetyltransferase [Lachnospiraceae bacterium]|nr:GNAT family acetyltransferase [Lachnospiraceae bacterium]